LRANAGARAFAANADDDDVVVVAVVVVAAAAAAAPAAMVPPRSEVRGRRQKAALKERR
jgi:hypothetical protein